MEDYELTNARQWDESLEGLPVAEEPSQFDWQKVGAAKKKAAKAPPRTSVQSYAQPTRPFRPLPFQQQPGRPRFPLRRFPPKPLPLGHPTRQPNFKLVDVADNDAEYAWRERKPPTDTVRIPAVLIMNDRGTQGDDPGTIERLAKENGVFVHCEERKSLYGSLTFGVWGDVKNVEAAKLDIFQWIEANGPNGGSHQSKWGKLISLTPELQRRAEKQWKRDIKRNRYRQFPPTDMAFEAIGTFHWPSDEYSPDEAFGKSCEALDPIRMDCECYIKFSDERSVFLVCGKASNVRSAITRIRLTCYQMAARYISPVRAYLIQWRDLSTIPTHVYVEEQEDPKVQGAAQSILSHSPRGEGRMKDQDEISCALESSDINAERIRSIIASAMGKLHYYRGHLQLRVRLGIFVLETYKNPEDGFFTLDEYEAMTRETQFAGRVTTELGDRYQESKALERLQKADDLLQPSDMFSQDVSLTKPIYSASFIFPSERGDLKLLMTWNEAADQGDATQFTEPSVKWTRLDRDTGREAKLLSLSLTDLHTSSAIQFEITATDIVEKLRISPPLTNFVKQVSIKPEAVLRRDRTKPFVTYNQFATLKSMRQSITYKYGIKPGNYTLEVTELQDRVYTKPMQPPTVYEPRVSLHAYRTEWDTMLGKNERLAVGTKAEWDDEITTWLPPDWEFEEGTEGFKQLLQKMTRIEEIVRAPRPDTDDE